MDGEHPAIKEGASFLSDSLILILGIDVLKDLFGVEGMPIIIISLDPQPGGEVVLVI